MEKFNRAVRFQHKVRLKKNRSIYWFTKQEKHTVKTLGKIVDTPCPCSCYMCGNPRKYFKNKTRNEELHLLIFKEQLNHTR